ncbi:class I SAM-dependent methyltransferase [Mycolicibacterium sp.]|uniref:class I SAM-dependent methyltransferase n=1 Tax=Mycolicibacterium sp. TaxID=2320850 RepID=UPI003D0BD25D
MSRRRAFNSAVTRFWSFAAPAYDAEALQRWVYRPAHDEMISLLKAHHCDRIVDVGCGTGILAARIAEEVRPEEIYGVDFSEGMLTQARNRSADVRWLTGPAEQLPFGDGSLDAALTTSAFHFFNQRAALREFHRVLAPGGIAAVATFSPYQPFPSHCPVPSPLHWPGLSRFNPLHSPSPQTMRRLFIDAGFGLVDQHRVHRPLWTRPLSDLITVGVKSG